MQYTFSSNPSCPVADAFVRRQWLVELVYAQESFCVAVSSIEAGTAEEAARVASSRAPRLYKAEDGTMHRLGNLLHYTVMADTEPARKYLKLTGQEDPAPKHSTKWKQA